MAKKIVRQRNNPLNKIFKEAEKSLKPHEMKNFKPYINMFYSELSKTDLIKHPPIELFNRAHHAWLHSKERKSNTPSIQVFNPILSMHGFKSNNTVIEVITEDMPFVVSSISSALNDEGLTVHFLVHPTIYVRRSEDFKILDFIELPDPKFNSKKESVIHLEITHQTEPEAKKIKKNLELILKNILCYMNDKNAITNEITAIIEDIHPIPKGFKIEEISEVQEFVSWLLDSNFIFLGCREYNLVEKDGADKLIVDENRNLGILSDPKYCVFRSAEETEVNSPDIQKFQRHKDIILVTKTNVRSIIDRTVHMDAIGIKKFDKKGDVIGHRLFVGLFTQTSYNQPTSLVPLLRRRLKMTIEKAGFAPASYNNNSLKNILESYPRDELFQINDRTLLNTALGILELESRPRPALFIREDELGQFCSCLVYIPRERYNTELRQTIQKILSKELHGTVAAFYIQMGDKPLARCQIILRMTTVGIPGYNQKKN